MPSSIQPNGDSRVRQQEETPIQKPRQERTAAGAETRLEVPKTSRDSAEFVSRTGDRNSIKPEASIWTPESALQTAAALSRQMTDQPWAAVATQANATPQAVLALLRG